FVIKYVPKEEQQKGYIDVIGLFLIGVTAAALMMYVSNFNWLYLLGFIVALVVFLLYIAKAKKAFIHISFFQNKHFISIMFVAFIIYSVQLAYIFMFPLLWKVFLIFDWILFLYYLFQHMYYLQSLGHHLEQLRNILIVDK